VKTAKEAGLPSLAVFIVSVMSGVSALTGLLVFFRTGYLWGAATWLLLFGFMITWDGIAGAVVKRQTKFGGAYNTGSFQTATVMNLRYQKLLDTVRSLKATQLRLGEPALEPVFTSNPPKVLTVKGLLRKIQRFRVVRCGVQVLMFLLLFVAVGLQSVPVALTICYVTTAVVLGAQWLLLSRWTKHQVEVAEPYQQKLLEEAARFEVELKSAEEAVIVETSRLDWLEQSQS